MCLGLQEYESGSGWHYMSYIGTPTGLTVSRKDTMPTNEVVFMVFQRLSAIASGSWSHGRVRSGAQSERVWSEIFAIKIVGILDGINDLAIGHARTSVHLSGRRLF
jgi:hypothetical protein